ncbi:hypothetical protein [Novipirellula artificiosorum]|uniref:Uncharacterized protein n=1 Tax=Novipirellula artificiosorum TaxID=2528016 RepID=A0A5C6DQZ6_9BACT|nr:hypothetical protein [Novipirellula artificiosorum]TWU38604.1 hypothetical protein Poly41_30810 [Novipirellula artificiosorum]
MLVIIIHTCGSISHLESSIHMAARLDKIAILAILGIAVGCSPGAKDSMRPATSNGGESPEITSSMPVGESGSVVGPENADSALDAFQVQAFNSLPEDLSSDRQAFAVRAIKDREHLHARRLTCQACFQRIDGTLRQDERQSLILFGTIDDLRGQAGNCWEIMSFGTFGNSIEGYIDVDTGRLLVLWIVPEG